MSNEVDRTLWVGNLHEKATEEILYELFLQAGPLEKVKIAKDKEGRQKNFAFITFEHSCSVPYTIQLLNQTPLYGTPLKIQCRSGSVHQQQPHQLPLPPVVNQNPYQNNLQMGNPFQGNIPPMKPYRSTQPMRSQYQNGAQSMMAANPYQNNQPRGTPLLHKSNTWHGNDLKGVDQDGQGTEQDRERDREGRNGDYRDRYSSRERDRDRSGDRHRHGDRGRHSESRNSPQNDSNSSGHNSPQESQRDRLLRMQQASLNTYRQNHSARSSGGQNQSWQSRPHNHRRGRY